MSTAILFGTTLLIQGKICRSARNVSNLLHKLNNSSTQSSLWFRSARSVPSSVVICLQRTGEAASRRKVKRGINAAFVSTCEEILAEFVLKNLNEDSNEILPKLRELKLPPNAVDILRSEFERKNEEVAEVRYS